MHTLTITGLIFVVWIGAWAARKRILEEPARHLRLLRVAAVGGIGLAVAGGLPMGQLGPSPTAHRRLARGYELDPVVSEAVIRRAAINTITRLIARGRPAIRQGRRTFTPKGCSPQTRSNTILMWLSDWRILPYEGLGYSASPSGSSA